MESEEMETYWFFRLRFRRAYDSAYDSDFLFSLGHKLFYDSDYEFQSYGGIIVSLNPKAMWKINRKHLSQKNVECFSIANNFNNKKLKLFLPCSFHTLF